VSSAGQASYVFSEIGPSATGAIASRATLAANRAREAPSSTSTSAASRIVATPHSAMSDLNAAL